MPNLRSSGASGMKPVAPRNPLAVSPEEDDEQSLLQGAMDRLVAISQRRKQEQEDAATISPVEPDADSLHEEDPETEDDLSQEDALSASVEESSSDRQDDPSSGSSDASALSAHGGAMPETTETETPGVETPTAGGTATAANAGAADPAASSPGGEPPALTPEEKPSQITVAADDWEALRSKNRELLDEKRKVQQELRKLKEAQMSDEEKRNERFKDLESENVKLKAQRRGDAARMAAIQAQAVRPDKVAKLALAESGDEEDFDFEKYFSDLKKDTPEFFTKPAQRAGSADGGEGAPPARKEDANTFLRRKAGIIR